jgi:hypothetical protein
MTDDPNRGQNATGANKEASSNRDTNPANQSGIQTTTTRNVSLGVERTRSRRGKNKTGWTGANIVNSDARPRRCDAGVAELHFISTFIVEEDIWQTKA